MRLRARLVTTLVAATACNGTQADAGAPSRPPPSRPVTATPVAAPVAPAKITPVTTLFIASQPRPAGEIAPPWSLTASDGSGLMLTRVDARAVVEGPLAFTELHLYFHNPEARTREGTFSITLPPGAAVSRFAMETSGQFLEAEVVEKQRARQVYEDFLHRKQDPALLEKGEGNQFSARVFPIPANADKHLVISYSQEVAPGHYTLPLRGLARSERVDVRVQVRGTTGGIAEQTLSQRNWTPDRDVVVDATAIGAPAAVAAGELAATRIRVELPDAAAAPASVTILVDTSASRALGFAAQARTVHQLVDELARDYGGALPVQVVAFDQITTPLYDGRADKIGGIEAALVARGALGASDLGQALAWLAGHAPHARVVVVTDGVVTAGARTDALPQLARQLAARGVDRIDVALIGGIRDGEAAAAVAHAALAHTGAILDLDRGVAETARRIGLTVRTEIPVAADGARWVFPHAIDAAQSGDEVTVFVRRDPQAQQLGVTVAGKRTVVSPVGVEPALLGRAVAAAEITELDHQLAKLTGAPADKLRAEIVRRSIAARVVSSQTSMLVLESDADYARYGIDRTALAEILAIGPSGVELLHRAAPAQIAAPRITADIARKPRALQKKADKALDDEKRADQLALDEGSLDNPLAEREAAGKELSAPRVAMTRGAQVDRSPGTGAVRLMDPGSPAHGAMGGAAGSASASAQGVAAPREERVRMHADSAAPPAPPPAVTAPSPASPRPSQPARPLASPAPRPEPRAVRQSEIAADRDADGVPDASDVYSGDDDGLSANRRKPALHGPLAEIERALAAGRPDAALASAKAWHGKQPGDVLALIGLGDALE
ncbi:MAG TPA: VIT domain-containing protein, partial [Kofleriaceae bacterium]|nr:VIT domain-containing protein [Kofleriaceae bacterium]